MMGFDEIRQAIEAYQMTWPGTEPVALDGTATPPAVVAAKESYDPWIRMTLNHGASLTAGIGSAPCVRRTGLIQLQVFTPEQKGSAPAAQIADSLAAHWEFYQAGHFETQAASVQRIGPQDGYFQFNVTVPFRAG